MHLAGKKKPGAKDTNIKAAANKSNSKPVSDDAQTVYSGRLERGNIVKSRGVFLAYDDRGRKIGKFPSGPEAMRAVLAAPAAAS